ncbi:carbonic anhydrase [Lactarius quietus]|nr:carbonic anhydrase [Lactarius quietus]
MGDSVLQKLFSANAQWAEAVKKAEPDFFDKSANNPQKPKILWLGCSDSRVPESVVTASPPGYIFVHRNIANQIHPKDENALAVITYAVGHIHSIEDVVVVGHTHCGGAHAAIKLISPNPPNLEPVLQIWLNPLVDLAKNLAPGTPPPDLLMKLIEESVRVQVNNVARSEPLRKAWAEGRKVRVHGLVYHLETGLLRDLGVTKDSAS